MLYFFTLVVAGSGYFGHQLTGRLKEQCLAPQLHFYLQFSRKIWLIALLCCLTGWCFCSTQLVSSELLAASSIFSNIPPITGLATLALTVFSAGIFVPWAYAWPAKQQRLLLMGIGLLIFWSTLVMTSSYTLG